MYLQYLASWNEALKAYDAKSACMKWLMTLIDTKNTLFYVATQASQSKRSTSAENMKTGRNSELSLGPQSLKEAILVQLSQCTWYFVMTRRLS